MIEEMILSGFYAVLEYLSAHVLLCLVPAFFISGAFTALIPATDIINLMGNASKKFLAYMFAATSGLILEVCSCTILPLFAAIWRKGAGFGPAITFLFAGPGITLLSTPLTAAIFGMEFALVKLSLSIIIAILIGVSMEIIFKGTINPNVQSKKITIKSNTKRKQYQTMFFLLSLVMIMVFGTSTLNMPLKLTMITTFSIISVILAFKYYNGRERNAWLKETWKFFKMIFPILLIGVFLSGVLKPIIPQGLIARYAGQNTIFANIIAVLFGTIAYFPTLVEVPVARMFLELGMSKGPLMAYLIADPAISIQTMLVVNRIIKPKKTIAYALLIIIFSTLAGYMYGILF